MKLRNKILPLFLSALALIAATYPVAHCAADGPTENGHRFDPDCVAAQEFSLAGRECCELHQADAEGHDWHHYHFLFENASSENRLRIDNQSVKANNAYNVVDTFYCPDADLKLRRAAVPSPLPDYFHPLAVPTGLSPPC